jgi:hypothetical protein
MSSQYVMKKTLAEGRRGIFTGGETIENPKKDVLNPVSRETDFSGANLRYSLIALGEHQFTMECVKKYSFFIPALSFALLLSAGLIASGCLEPYPAAPPEQPAATPTGETGERLSQPTAMGTPVGEVRMEEGPSGYVMRSFGLVPYETPPDYHLTYIDSAARHDGLGGVSIEGLLKNDGPAHLRYLQVTFHLFDASGNVLGNVEAEIEYLPAGTTWHYTTTTFQTDAYQYYSLAAVVAQ